MTVILSPPLLDSALARKLSAFAPLADSDLALIAALHRRRRRFPVGMGMIHQGQEQSSAFVLASGWACSYKFLPNGARQIISVQIPGDVLGLQSALLPRSDQTVEPITAVFASEISRRDLTAAFSGAPGLATAALLSAARDAAMRADHIVSLGRRTAAERMGHFLLELWARLRRVGLATPGGYPCPLSQYMLADTLGLSAVHVNRVLRELREKGLVTFQKGAVTFQDPHALMEFSGFDRSTLDPDGQVPGPLSM
jgi:CRP-like cAMP-binding protein